MSILVRADTAEGPLLQAVQQEVHRLDPSLALADVKLMDQVASSAVATPRFSLALVGLFGAMALVLAGIGMYGVVAYSVGQRTHEFGLRMALGATARDVQSLVLLHGVKLALAGVGLGVICAALLSRAVRSLLYGVRAEDPLTFAAVAAIAVAVAVLACYVPARRATQADPMTSLRCD
jgi:ABC-type antimicrobial peptide transport system permease subunit